MLKIAYSPLFCHRLPVSHRFPMAKYDLIPKKLLTDGIITQDNLFHPELLSEQEILSTHTADYWHKLKTGTLTDKEIRKIGLPMSASLIKRERYITHATYECACTPKNMASLCRYQVVRTTDLLTMVRDFVCLMMCAWRAICS